MNSYLINVAMSFWPFLIASAMIWIGGIVAIRIIRIPGGIEESKKKTVREIRIVRKIVVGLLLAVGLLLSLTYPTNTPKNSIGNVASENRAIENAIMERQAGEVTDLSRQPKMDDAERKAHFDSLVEYKRKAQ